MRSCCSCFVLQLRRPVMLTNADQQPCPSSIKLARTINFTQISQFYTNTNTTSTIKMANDSVPDRAFTEALNELNKYYEDDELDTCVEKARELLQDIDLPRYHRIRTLVLCGSAVEYGCSSPCLDKCLPLHRDWREGRCCCLEADTLWRLVRHLHPAGENEKNDAALDELRDYILELRAALDEEQSRAGDGPDVDVDDDEAAVQARLVDYETELAEEKALVEAEKDDPEALLAADAKP
jgi:hypothetical protein